MAMLSTEYNEALTGKVAERLGVKESLDKLSTGLGPSQTLGESAEAGIAAADKTYGQTISAARQQATAGVAQATAEKQALADPGTLSAGQKSYLGRGYDEQAAQYRTAYDTAAEQAATTRKQAYSNIYSSLQQQVDATSKQYTEFMTALLNSSYGIDAIAKVAQLNQIEGWEKWFTTKGEEYAAANNLVGVDISKFGAEKQALLSDASRTWASATLAEDAIEALGLYDTESEIGKQLRYALTGQLYNGENSWYRTWTQEERNKYLPILDAFRQDVLGYSMESYAAEREQQLEKAAAAKEKATAAGGTRYAGQGELGKGGDTAATGKAIKLTLDGTKYDIKLGTKLSGDSLNEVTQLIYNATGNTPQVGDVTRIGDKLYIVTANGVFEGLSSSGFYSEHRDKLLAKVGGASYVKELTSKRIGNTIKLAINGEMASLNKVTALPTELPATPINGTDITINGIQYIYYDGQWWSRNVAMHSHGMGSAGSAT